MSRSHGYGSETRSMGTGTSFCIRITMGRPTGMGKVSLHREIVPPRETVAIARVAIAIVGRGG